MSTYLGDHEMSSYIMPIKINVTQAETMRDAETARFFTRDGEPLISMTDRPENEDIIHLASVEMTDKFYCELISILSTKDAERIISEYPKLRFAFHGHPCFQIDEIDTMMHYKQAIVNSVCQFNDLRALMALKKKYLHIKKKFTEETIYETDFSMVREQLIEIYKRNFRSLNQCASFQSVYDMEDFYFNSFDRVDEISEQFAGTDEQYYELLEEYFNDHPDKRKAHYKNVQRQVNDTVDERLFADLATFLYRVSSEATIIFNPDDSTIECRCADLLTAMYMMADVLIINEEEFRECAHPKCHAYYKVDKAHPQTMCDRHMAARRKKRQNAKEKERQEMQDSLWFIE